MKIGELAARADTQVETIRYYEREGLLLAAPRTDGNYRIYGDAHLERLAFIRHCRSLDMTLDEIRVLLRFKDDPEADCGDVNALLDEHIGHVAARIRNLRQLEKQLKALRLQCAGAGGAAHCGILGGLSQAATGSSAAPSGSHHVAGAHGRGRSRRA
ncbi:MAG: Cd(II)/Pb(II)-responsive transcriptional regulator [Methylibium sp.]